MDQETSEHSEGKSAGVEEKREKRKRERGSSHNEKSRRRKSSRSERTPSGGAAAATQKKVKTISQLVKLVISGEVKVPQTLRNFVSDRPALLDQVFSILSESDVRGMLPDILKDLKLRQVKELCMEQLKKMSDDDIMDCIEPDRHKSQSLNVDAAVFELLGEPPPQPVDPVPEGDNKDTGAMEEEQRIESAVININEGEGENALSMASESAKQKTAVEKMAFSDVSNGEEEEENDLGENRCQSSPQMMECDTTTSEISRESSSKRMEEVEEEEEKESEPLEQQEEEESEVEDTQSVSSRDGSSGSDLDDCWLSEFPDEISEWARLREIEFRRRALEAELRRRGEEVVETIKSDEETNEEVAEETRVDKSQAIELQLRQRALQSLLTKKKQIQ